MTEQEHAAVAGSTGTLKTLADGTVRLQIDVDPPNRKSALSYFSEPGTPVAIALLEGEAATGNVQPTESKPDRPYGQQAKILRQSAFFRTPAVWEALGSDADFQHWVTYQRSIVSGEYSEIDDAGNGRCVACHVRRADEAGTAYKPPYACVPMTDAEHRMQHNQGEDAVVKEQFRIKGSSADGWLGEPDTRGWFDRKRIETVQAWAWEMVKHELGYASMADVPPSELREWAEAAGLAEYLPGVYREAV